MEVLKKYGPLSFLTLVSLMVLSPRLFIDLWNDEIYTLKFFTLQPWDVTLWDYHVPNNHVFFNVLNHLVLSVLDVDSLKQLFLNPWITRLVPFISAIGTVWVLYKLGELIKDKLLGFLSGMVLLTTLAYVNFALQVRGYGLSVFLLISSVYLGCYYFKYSNRKLLLLISTNVGLLIWTIPSNLIFILIAIGLLFFNLFLKKWNRKETGETLFSLLWTSKESKLIAFVLLGVLFGMIMYVPIWNDVFNNEYVDRSDYYLDWQLFYYVKQVFRAMISQRWLLVVVAIGGFLALSIKTKKLESGWLLLFLFCVLPLWFPYLSKTVTPGRVFIVLSPFYALFFSGGIFLLLEQVNINSKVKGIIWFLFSIYLCVSFYLIQKKAQVQNVESIKSGVRLQDINEQYFSFAYKPMEMVGLLKSKLSKTPLSVYVLGGEPHGITNYLSEFHIPFQRFEDKAEAENVLFKNEESFFLVSNKLPDLKGKIEMKTERLNELVNYHNLFHCQKSSWAKNVSKDISNIDSGNDSLGLVIGLSYPWSVATDSLRFEEHFLIKKGVSQRRGLMEYIHDKNDVVFISEETKITNGYRAILRNKYQERETFAVTEPNMFRFRGKRKNRSDVIIEVDMNSSTEFYSIKRWFVDSGVKDSLVLIFNINSEEAISPILTLSINRNEKQYHWEGFSMKDFFTENEWCEVVLEIPVPKDVKIGDEMVLNIWNKDKQDFKISQLQLLYQ